MTTQQESDERRRLERAREIALFRYSLVQELISPGLTAAERGRRAHLMAAVRHPAPGGQLVRVSYQSIGRWKRAYLAGGFEALVPAPRQASPRTPEEVLDLAAALKRENPARTAAQVRGRERSKDSSGHVGGLGVRYVLDVLKLPFGHSRDPVIHSRQR